MTENDQTNLPRRRIYDAVEEALIFEGKESEAKNRWAKRYAAASPAEKLAMVPALRGDTIATTQPHKLIIIREGVLASWAKDVVTLVCPIVAAVLNHRYAGGSGIIYAAIAFFWITAALAWATRAGRDNFMSPEEALNWLREHYPHLGITDASDAIEPRILSLKASIHTLEARVTHLEHRAGNVRATRGPK